MPGDETALLYQISRQLNSDLDIDRVLADALRLTVEHTAALNGSIIVFGERGSVAHKILARAGMPPEQQEAVVAEVLSQGLAGWVVEHKQGGIVDTVLSDPRWISFPDDELKGGSAVGVPLLRSDQVIGVVTLRHPDPRFFAKDHLDLLVSIADQASIAIDNARLFHSVQAERAKMAAIINGAGEAILVTDQQGQMVMLNALARQVFSGSNSGSWENLPFTELVPYAELGDLWHHRDDSAYPSSAEVPLDDGRTFFATLTGIPDVGYIIVMQDVTDLNELNQMKTEFVSAVSHDLRSPLQLIYTYANMIAEAGPLNAEQQSFLDGIDRGIVRMTGLIDDLLDLAKIEAGVGMELESCQLDDVITQVIERFGTLAHQKELTFVGEVPPELPPVHANAGRIDQVLSNLIDNAIKYTPRGTVTVRATSDDRQVTTYVIDSGIGLMPSEQKELFSRFYRAQNELTEEIEGTGLGLAIARSIIDRHGGKIWVQSTWGKGSTFAFCLPLERQG